MKKITLLIIFIWHLRATAQIAVDTLPAGWWRVPRTEARITFYGYVKADMIHDFQIINSPIWFNTVDIPTDSVKGTNSQLVANETRLMFDYITPFRSSYLRAYVEGDFYGSVSNVGSSSGGDIRMRHAFLEIGPHWLAGQIWTNFMDEDVIPLNLDVEKPQGFSFIRHGIVRYKTRFGEHQYIALALEQPYVNVDPPTTPGAAENFVPDLTGRYRYTDEWGHLQVSGFFANVRFRPTVGALQYTVLSGFSVSGRYNFYKKDFVLFQVLVGPGLTRYRGGLYAAPDANDKLKGIPGRGYLLSFTHFWTSELRSVVMANYGVEKPLASQPGTNLKSTLYSAADLIWQFDKSAFVAIEYLYGFRQDVDDAFGYDNRVMISFRLDFNKQDDFNHRVYPNFNE